MEFKGLKINVIILVIIVVIIAYFSGQYLLKMYNVNKPLKENLLEVKGIDDLSLIDNNGKTDILVSFKPGIDFFQVYNKVAEIAEDQLDNNLGGIKIKNESNQNLKNIFYQMHFAIYEGIATNKYTLMKSKLEKIAEENSLNNYKVWVDNKAVYLQMNDGNGYLYRRIKRTGRIISIETGGGENSG